MNNQTPQKQPDGPYIETVSGYRFFYYHPQFNPYDIAHGLSMMCRFAGQCSRFYSVAEHSVLVAWLLKHRFSVTDGQVFEGLIHDAEEAYLGDMPSPIKYALPDYQSLGTRIITAFRKQLELPVEKTELCHLADKVAGFLEASYLMRSHGEEQIGNSYHLREAYELAQKWRRAAPRVVCFQPAQAYELWLGWYREFSNYAGRDLEYIHRPSEDIIYENKNSR
jgi:uncharacterized protein